MPYLRYHKHALIIALTALAGHAFASPGPSRLGKDDLFNILAAEFSIQRDDFSQALGYYLSQARTQNNPYLAERATQLAMQQGRYVDMLEAAKIWQTAAPQEELPCFFTSLAYALNMQPNAALEHMRKVLHMHGETDFTRLVNLIPQGSSSEDFYIHELQQAEQEYPHNYDIPLALALLYQRHNQEDLALTYTDKVIANAGNNLTAIEFGIRLYARYDKTDKAMATYRAAISDHPDNLDLRQSFALFVLQHDLDLAQEQFEYLLEHRPDDDSALLNLGLIALEKGGLDAAEDYFLRLRQTGQRVSSANYYLGETYRLQKSFDAAIAAYANVTEKEDAERATEKSIAILIEQKRHAQAHSAIQAALEKSTSPEHTEQLQILKAFNLEHQGNILEAYQLLTQLLDKNPDSFELRYSRAMLAETRNELDKMESDLRYIINRYPDSALALNALGYTLADKTTRYREALELIKQAQLLVPDDPAILDSLGWVLFRMGRFAEAIHYLKHSLEILPDSEVAAHLGEALWVSGQQENARQVFRDALNRNPGHPILNDTIKRLNLSF